MKSKQVINLIRDNNLGVRSGVYCAITPSIRMEMDEKGEYQYIFSGSESDKIYEKLSKVDLMSSVSLSEDVLAKQLFSGIRNGKFDTTLGYYTNLFAGYVEEGDFRKNGSSGGMTSWILNELLTQGKIDAVIHAQATNVEETGRLFKYGISRSGIDIQKNAKTRYYPLELSEVLDEVKNTPGRYAVVGIPEFISELRLLSSVEPLYKERIVYLVGLVCGHQKSAKYVEALAWQQGIKPGDLRSVDFRVKQPKSTAYDYLQQFTGFKDGALTTITKSHDDLFADHWPMGFFKSKFSDFTDNAFNELADVVLGDAWLDEYNSDGMGNNIVIVRNPDIADIIKKGIKNKSLVLDDVDDNTIKQSQSGLIHHIKDELPYRLFRQSRVGWVPVKRVEPGNTIPKLRKRVQDIRYRSSVMSHDVYKRAVQENDWSVFLKTMKPLLEKYNKTYEKIAHEGPHGKKLREKLRIRTRLRSLKQKLRIRTRLQLAYGNMKRAKYRAQFRKADGAIITLPGYYNYGNMVQRFATQKFLEKHGYRFVSYAKDQEVSADEAERLEYTRDFVERNIWRKQFDEKDAFKAFIVGSDQVWRKWGYDDIFDELGYYFLDFAQYKDVKRIAYAASIGQDTLKAADYTDEFIPFAKKLVQKFDYIGMREASGVEIVKKEWGADAQLVIDPTLLLEAADYNELIGKAPYEIKKISSMFTYFILTDKPKRALIAKIAKDAGLKDEGIYLESNEKLRPVEEWLAGIRDAKLVVIDSFHGMVFSIINNTPFVVLESGTGGASRITTLLGQLGLEDRYILSKGAESFDVNSLNPIDWKTVNNKLDKLRASSSEWLLNAVRSSNDN